MPDKQFILRNIDEVHFEVTAQCNLKCKYCYAEPYEAGSKDNFMRIDTVKKTIDLLSEYSQKQHIEIIFHGGEPLLQNPTWFDECCNYVTEKFTLKNKNYSFGLQTNNILLNTEFIEVFLKHNINVGVSLDGTEKIHNQFRGGFNKTIKNIKLLENSKLFSGVISVISHHNFDKISEIFQEFYNQGFSHFSINIASAVGNGQFSEPLSAEQIFNIYEQDYINLLKYDGKIVEFRLIERIRRHFEAPDKENILTQLRCDNPFCHAGSNMIFIKVNEDLFPCGSAGSSGKIENFKLGNLSEPLSKQDYYTVLKRFHQKTDKYIMECQNCKAKYFCEHGCPAFDFTDPITTENKCIANKQFVNFLNKEPKENINKLLSYKL